MSKNQNSYMQINFEISYILSYSRCENIEIAYVNLVKLLYCEEGSTLLVVDGDTHHHEAVAAFEDADFHQILELVETGRQHSCCDYCCKIHTHKNWTWAFLIYEARYFGPLG